MPTSGLDSIDRKILEALQAEGRLSMVDLADRVGLSASPCLRRVKRLEEDGYIAGYQAVVDRERVGLGLTIFVGIRVDGHGEATERAFEGAVQRIPEVVACHLVSGEADFLLEVVVPDLKRYEQLLMGTLLRLPMVRDIRSSFAMRTVKPPAPLPLAHLPAAP